MAVDFRIQYKADINSTNIHITELGTECQVQIYKVLTLVSNLQERQAAYYNLLKQNIIGDITKCNIIEFILILLKIRFVSIGSSITLKVELDDKQAEYELNLNDTYSQLLETNAKIKDKASHISDINIIYSLPRYNSLFDMFKVLEKEELSIEDIVPFFIKSVKFTKTDTAYELTGYSYDERKALCLNLPVDIYKEAREYIKEVTDAMSTVFLYKSISNKDIYLNILGKVMFNYIDFLFEGDLANLHEQIFILTSFSNLTLSDISNMCELERALYIGFIQQRNSKKEGDMQSIDEPSEEFDQEEVLMNQLFG